MYIKTISKEEATRSDLYMLNGMPPCSPPTRKCPKGSRVPVALTWESDSAVGCMWLMLTAVLAAFFLCAFTLMGGKRLGQPGFLKLGVMVMIIEYMTMIGLRSTCQVSLMT